MCQVFYTCGKIVNLHIAKMKVIMHQSIPFTPSPPARPPPGLAWWANALQWPGVGGGGTGAEHRWN